MNNLINRDYHETIGKIIKFDVNEDLQRGNQYLDRIPYNYIGEMEEQLKRKPTKDTPLQMTDEQITALYPRLCFNLPNNETAMFEDLHINLKCPHELGWTTVWITNNLEYNLNRDIKAQNDIEKIMKEKDYIDHSTDQLENFLNTV